MLLNWWKQRRRRELRSRPVPAEWEQVLQENVAFFARLTPPEKSKLLADMQVFVAEKRWEGCAGLEVTEEMQVTIAAQACLLVLGFEDELFDLVQTLLIYPSDYSMPGKTVLEGGIVLEGEHHRSGEAWYRGPVILSWTDALQGGLDDTDGENVVLHEFAHQLDMQNGRVADGIPPLETTEQLRQWEGVMHKEYQQLQKDCLHRRHTLLDCYGTENLAEFFAVATECFFEQPRLLSLRHDELYAVLMQFYRQDTLRRF